MHIQKKIHHSRHVLHSHATDYIFRTSQFAKNTSQKKKNTNLLLSVVSQKQAPMSES